MDKLLLKLYITGKTPRSERAIKNIRKICDTVMKESYQLLVIDVLERPQVAEDEKIMATPTLVRESPPPSRRIIGDLSEKEQVFLGLDIKERKGESS